MVQEKGEVGILFFFGVGISWGQPWSFQTLGGSFSVPKLGSEKFFYAHFSLVFNKGGFWMEFSTTSGRTWWGLYWLQHCCQWHMPHSHRVRCQGKVFQRWLCISHFFRKNLEMKLGPAFFVVADVEISLDSWFVDQQWFPLLHVSKTTVLDNWFYNLSFVSAPASLADKWCDSFRGLWSKLCSRDPATNRSGWFESRRSSALHVFE